MVAQDVVTLFVLLPAELTSDVGIVQAAPMDERLNTVSNNVGLQQRFTRTPEHVRKSPS